jgi:hypothetical protein
MARLGGRNNLVRCFDVAHFGEELFETPTAGGGGGGRKTG